MGNNNLSTASFEIDHNVYVLGAGFSKDAGLPLLTTFLASMREARASGQLNSLENDAIDALLEYRLHASLAASRVPINPDNIEDLLSLVLATPVSVTTDSQRNIARELPIAIGATLSYRQKLYFQKSPTRIVQTNTEPDHERWLIPQHQVGDIQRQVPLYDLYVALMCGYFNKTTAQKDTIITFNYDTLIEDALTRMKVPYNYGYSSANLINHGKCQAGLSGHLTLFDAPTDSIPLLKLHGSINWADGEPDSSTGLVPRLFYDSYDELVAEDAVPLIEPPTWRKGGNDILRTVWDRAVNALQIATRIIFIGYSAPATDPHFRFLMAAGLAKNICLSKVVVVNPDDKVSEDIQQTIALQGGVFERYPTANDFFSIYSDNINRKPPYWTKPPG
ncbi:SIR2 family protein [Acidithiobacillus ferrivorans]|uniref:SIR2 family protein n=1 Tax=Acidithiobacillus ferrivorans TaxID=160808 RepID=UPI001C067AEC|nr:SIR2 family protein [Acidithiobacillus ferrivorans]MBU2850581.1 hypothetical protein [Acidithiobacillus ferrivorans]